MMLLLNVVSYVSMLLTNGNEFYSLAIDFLWYKQ